MNLRRPKGLRFSRPCLDVDQIVLISASPIVVTLIGTPLEFERQLCHINDLNGGFGSDR